MKKRMAAAFICIILLSQAFMCYRCIFKNSFHPHIPGMARPCPTCARISAARDIVEMLGSASIPSFAAASFIAAWLAAFIARQRASFAPSTLVRLKMRMNN